MELTRTVDELEQEIDQRRTAEQALEKWLPVHDGPDAHAGAMELAARAKDEAQVGALRATMQLEAGRVLAINQDRE